MVKLFTRCAVVGAALLATALPSKAQFSPITQPDAGYLSSTTKLTIAEPDFTTIDTLTDGTQTVTFDQSLVVLTVPTTWSSWGAPPDTESSSPTVLWTNGITSLTLSLAELSTTFGFEAQPNTSVLSTMTAEFFNNGTLLGTITLDVDGNGGARLFAASDPTGFDQVIISANDDFAIGQLRYATSQSVPEPGVLALAVSASGIGLILRRRRR